MAWMRGNRITYLAGARPGGGCCVGGLRARHGVAGQGVLGVAAVAGPVGAGLGVHGAAAVGLVRVLEVLLGRVGRVLAAVLRGVGRARGRDGRI